MRLIDYGVLVHEWHASLDSQRGMLGFDQMYFQSERAVGVFSLCSYLAGLVSWTG
jgi:hypothetical protein